jgi:hypothetical protein
MILFQQPGVELCRLLAGRRLRSRLSGTPSLNQEIVQGGSFCVALLRRSRAVDSHPQDLLRITPSKLSSPVPRRTIEVGSGVVETVPAKFQLIDSFPLLEPGGGEKS